MPQTFEEQEYSTLQQEVEPFSDEQKLQIIMFGLMFIGFLLVLLSNPISALIVKEKSGSLTLPSNQAIQEWGATLRCIGSMLFATGLLERLAYNLNLRKI